jgi:type II secretory ATPase GspE/PulE/Tfp pilus assembly ATPase PilB-like protein
MPVTQNGSYDVPVMARRDLHGAYRSYSSSRFSSAAHSVVSLPTRFIAYIKSQLLNGYSVIHDRLTHQSSQQKQSSSQLLNSPSALRNSRSSSQSSTSGGQAGNYNLRRRAPIHSTPRDNENKISSKQQKDRKSQDSSEGEEENEKYQKQETNDGDKKDNIIVKFIKKIVHSPLDLLSFIFRKFFGLPWWLLIPLLLFLGFYACKYFYLFLFETISYLS